MNDTYRVEEAAAQLLRYGDEVRDARLLDVLDCLVEINDDMHHVRNASLIADQCGAAISILQSIQRDYAYTEARQKYER